MESKELDTLTADSHAAQICQSYDSDVNFLIDDDECIQLDVCQSGYCINTEGSFTCVCDNGYVLTGDGRTCTGKIDQIT